MSEVTAEQRLSKIREQNKIRAAKYYQAHKAEISKRRKERRDMEKPKEEKKEESKPKKIKILINRVIPLEKAVTEIDQKIESPASKNMYKNTLKSLVELLKCEDISKCFKAYEKTIESIETAKQKRDSTKGYSVNSKKAFYQAILKLSSILNIPLNQKAKDAYLHKFQETDVLSRDETKERMATEEVLSFEEYLPKVKKMFGEVSKEYIIASLYNLHGFRDNLQLEIVGSIPEDSSKNYIVIPKRGKMTIVLNNYKTKNRNGQQKISIPTKLASTIRSYVKKENITPNQFLLGDANLSSFIGRFNKKLGLDISINTLRQMKVSNPSQETSASDRVLLAKQMNHSPKTSEQYKRRIKIEVVNQDEKKN